MSRDVPDTPGVRATGSLTLGNIFFIVFFVPIVLAAILFIVSLYSDLTIEVTSSGQVQLDPLGPGPAVAAWGMLVALGLCDGLVLGLMLYTRPALLMPGTSPPRILRRRRFTGLALMCCGVWIIAFAAIGMAEELTGVLDGVFWGLGGRVALTLAGAPLWVIGIAAGHVYRAGRRGPAAGDG